MNRMIHNLPSIGLIQLLLFTHLLSARPHGNPEGRISVDVTKPGHTIAPLLFGIFFEDINLSADGGMYPELVRNRSFEDADTLQNWKFESADGKSIASICAADVQAKPPLPPLNAFNRKALCLNVNGPFKLENDGYWGMNVIQGKSYSLKLAARSTGRFNSPLNIRIVGLAGKILASCVIKDFDESWKYYSATMIAAESDPQAHLEIVGKDNGIVYLDMISLMPDQTWKNHGLRIDLADALGALHPRFLRFPGGCWVEGDDFAHMNNWKKTIGNADARIPLWNIWGYNATNGLGYHEYLQLAEDLGAEPLFCLNAGMSHKEIIPLNQMGQWVQDALDAIEYANGPINSVWGSLRSKNGHPQSLNLKYIEIGNENGMTPYAERWLLFTKTIHEKYPDIKLIANEWAGGHPQEPKPEIIDEHYYDNPDWFMWNAHKYDRYDRKGPKIFIGEYAVTSNTGNGNLRGAIGEAAWMTGMERNSDVVVMGSYAPLLCNANHKAWPVNLINYDSYRWYGLPSYYVQQMFANNQGTVLLPVQVENVPPITAPYSSGCIGLGTWNNTAEFKDVEVVAPNGNILFRSDFSKNIDAWRKIGNGDWAVHDGVLRQSSIAPNVTAFVGDTAWTDYSITLKARKLSGENGFQIYFRNRNSSERLRWDLGGFWNSVHFMETGITSVSMKAGIEPDRWYDIKIEILGNSVKGYLDGKLVQEVSDDRLNAQSLCASASRDDSSGEIILKVVNTAIETVTTQIDIRGAAKLSGNGKIIVLTSESPLDENTLENPSKVTPKTEAVKFSANSFSRSFPGNSLTVIRIPMARRK